MSTIFRDRERHSTTSRLAVTLRGINFVGLSMEHYLEEVRDFIVHGLSRKEILKVDFCVGSRACCGYGRGNGEAGKCRKCIQRCRLPSQSLFLQKPELKFCVSFWALYIAVGILL